MSFATDKQTLDDLNILHKPGKESVYAVFNNTVTRGGSQILEEMFVHPLSDVTDINKRSGIISYFLQHEMPFPLSSELFDRAELYLAMTDSRTRLAPEDNTLARKFSNLIAADGDYKVIYNGVIAIIEILQQVNAFTVSIKPLAQQTPYNNDLEAITTIVSDPDIAALLNERTKNKLSYDLIATYDHLIRFRSRSQMKNLLSYLYTLDVYMTVSRVAAKKSFVLPEALGNTKQTVVLEGIFHPLVKNAIGNTILISPENNIVFLTGANMAGKSTFMKSLGIAMYLAHMGFPVPAKKMQFSVQDGLYTTINLSDDLNAGNSHFYAEVLRVKKIAMELGRNKNLFIIFDELFRGTNVKDAYEGTIAITEAIAKKDNCIFVISTHIIEAGEVLKQKCNNILFTFLPTLMDGNKPVYTYTLKEGITADRHGMIIINNEGILDILRKRKHTNATWVS